MILTETGSLPLGIMHLILDKRKIGLGLSNLGSNPCSAGCILPSHHVITISDAVVAPRENKHLGRAEVREGEGNARDTVLLTAVRTCASWKSLPNLSWDHCVA